MWRPIKTCIHCLDVPTLIQYWIICKAYQNLYPLSWRAYTDRILIHLWTPIRIAVFSDLQGPHWHNIELYVKAYPTTSIPCLAGPTLIQYWIICESLSNTYSKYLSGPHWYNIESYMGAIQTTCFYISEKHASIIKSTKSKFRLKLYFVYGFMMAPIQS